MTLAVSEYQRLQQVLQALRYHEKKKELYHRLREHTANLKGMCKMPTPHPYIRA